MSGDSLFDRIHRLVSVNAFTVAIGFGVLAVAVTGGVFMGAPAVFGALGVIVVLAVFAMLARRNRRHGSTTRPSVSTILGHFALVGAVVFGLIQLVPYGRDHTNPSTTGEPAWASARTRELMVYACYGCHSNEVEWPWYSNIAPISWVVTLHVDDGREKVNYSEFDTDRGDAEETIEVIREGSMPPAYYTVLGLHPGARLGDAEIAELVAGLRLTPGLTENGESGGGEDDEEAEEHEEDDDEDDEDDEDDD